MRPEMIAKIGINAIDKLESEFKKKINSVHNDALRSKIINMSELQDEYRKLIKKDERSSRINNWYTIGILIFIVMSTPIFYETLQVFFGIRCFLPNNYLVWEATRPISDCNICRSVNKPLIFKNLTRDEFEPFAYSSQPIIIKKAISHWPAVKKLNFKYLKELYEQTPGALEEDCQFLHFRSGFKSLKEVFEMSYQRANFLEGQQPWYVGWSNCHPTVLEALRKLYPRPHFLPDDAEMPNTDYIFIGYEQGAFMHLDYIPRLMWQAQLHGNKTWVLAPTPECDHICRPFSFYVEPGDAVLVDTRVWYHGTSIPKGQFAITIQSEYG